MKQTLKYIYEILFEENKYAETKHSVSLTLATALTVFSASYLQNKNLLVTFLSSLAIIFSLISVFYSFIALSAKTIKIKNRSRKTSNNLLWYKDISRYDAQTYIAELKKTYPFPKNYKADKMDLDLAMEVIITSKVIYSKFLYFNFALIFLFLSVVCEVAVVVIMGI